MGKRWQRMPEGAQWGRFGADDQLGRLNLLTSDKVRQGAAEVREGLRFNLSLPLDVPGKQLLHPARHPPALKPVFRDGMCYFHFAMRHYNPAATDVINDDAMLIASQYSSQWDSLAHVGALFDADGDGTAEAVWYNGFRSVDPALGGPTYGEVGVHHLGIETMAAHGIQGRGVLVDLHAHFGRERRPVGYADLMRAMDRDGVTVERGDMLLLHTGFAEMLLEMRGDPDPAALHGQCCGLDGSDPALQRWIVDSDIAALIADNFAVELPPADIAAPRAPGPILPLHELCLFKLGLHLGELWHLTPLARWLRANGRSRFLLTAQPLNMPGAVGSPAAAIATV